MYEEYEENRLKPLENELGFKDTKFVWFSLEDMKAYAEAIKKENPEDKVSGIRIYFSAYPKNSGGEYSRHQTVFMAPTVELTNRKDEYSPMNHLPFIIQKENDDAPLKGKFEIIKELMLQNYKMENRLSYYDNMTARRKKPNTSNGASFSSGARTAQSANNGLTPTIYNEGELATPPEDEN